jgi:putative membrane protein
MHLRDGVDWAELARHLPPDELEALKAHRNVPIAILQTTGLQLRDAAHAGLLHAYHLPVLDQTLSAMTNIQGGCERIKQTPIPHSYTVLIHSIVALYCFGLPFGLVDTLHNWTPAVVLIVAYAFLGLDAVGDEIEDPFGSDVNDLPLSALSRNIEINLLQAIGEQALPDPPSPDEHNVLS